MRAARSLGWTSILAIEHQGDPEVAALIENLQRVDLSPIEEARGLQRLITDKGWSQDQAAAALGKTKGDVSAILRILTLPDEILVPVLTSELKPAKNVLIELARIDDPATLRRMAALATDGKLTIRAIRQAREGADVAPAEAVATSGMPRVDARGAGVAAGARPGRGLGRARPGGAASSPRRDRRVAAMMLTEFGKACQNLLWQR